MRKSALGFTLIELLTIMILLGVVSVTLMSRIGSTGNAAVLGGRDDILAALSFAQQTAMARDGISISFTSHSVSVTENGVPIANGGVDYPLALPANVSVIASTGSFNFDRLGRTTQGSIQLIGTGTSQGVSAIITLESSGYAHAD